MQTKAVLASLLLAVSGINAAPALETRQVASIPLNIYQGTACEGPVVTTVNVPTNGSCFPVSVVISGTVDSGRVDVDNALPAGCTLVLYNNANCEINNGVGNLTPIPDEHQCRTFGTGNPISNFIRAARTQGTCT